MGHSFYAVVLAAAIWTASHLWATGTAMFTTADPCRCCCCCRLFLDEWPTLYLSWSGWSLLQYNYSPDPVPMTLDSDSSTCNQLIYNGSFTQSGPSIPTSNWTVQATITCISLKLVYTNVTGGGICNTVTFGLISPTYTIVCDPLSITLDVVQSDPFCLGQDGGSKLPKSFSMSP